MIRYKLDRGGVATIRFSYALADIQIEYDGPDAPRTLSALYDALEAPGFEGEYYPCPESYALDKVQARFPGEVVEWAPMRGDSQEEDEEEDEEIVY